ncbi:MAG: DUF192 domain-containing protein [Candidatus Omnitrophica bacterium]|nr:DUF192 domain-containing protein [Candidatus Omnitrophota bacterium]
MPPAMSYRVENLTKSTLLADRARRAANPVSRALGLMGKKSLAPGNGMIFARAPSIHTCFMRFKIDVLFLDKDMRVIRAVHGLRPWRAAAAASSAYTIELPCGTLRHTRTEPQDEIRFSVNP